MEYIGSLILMIISELLLLGLSLFLRKEKKSQLKNIFIFLILCLFFWTLCSILQILTQNTNIDPFFWEKLAGFGVCISPIAFLTLSIIFAKTKIQLKRYHLILLIIPLTTILLTFTNDYHHLVFKHYSINMNETITGNYFIIHSIYTYRIIWTNYLLFFKLFY